MRSLTTYLIAGLLGTGAVIGASQSARADVVSLDLSGLQDREEIATYFDGGAGGNGSTGGPNYGIYFSGGSTAQTDPAGDQFSDLPYQLTSAAYFSQFAAGGAYLDAPTGFTGGFSFFYSNASGDPIEIDLYSGLDGTGSIVASLFLDPNQNTTCASGASFCTWNVAGVSFSGIAQSVDFADFNDFDNLENVVADITIGSSTPAPEPASLALVGAGAAFLYRMRHRKTV